MSSFDPVSLSSYRRYVEPSKSRTLLNLGLKLLLAAAYGTMVVILPPQLVFVLGIPIAAMLLVTLWMMPDRETYPHRAIERVFMPFIVFLIIWPSYIAVALPGLPWLTPTRILHLIIISLFVYSVSTSSTLRQQLLRVARVSPGVWICFVIFQVMMVITLPMSENVTFSVKKYFDNQIALTGMFFLGCMLFSNRGWATKIVGYLIVLALICAIDGFIELDLGYPPWANSIPSFMRVDDQTMRTVLGTQARSADGIYRVRGPFTNSGVLAEYLAVCIPFVLHWLFTGRTLVLRVAMAVAFVVIVAGALITQSRIGMVGTLIAVALYPLMWAFRQWKADKGTLVGPSILFGTPVAIVMVLGVVFSSHTLSTKVLGSQAATASNDSRAIQREMAIPRVLANPLGHGLGRSGETLGFINPGGFLTVDSHFITTVLDLGVVGLFSLYGMWLFAAAAGVGVYLRTQDRESELAGALGVTIFLFVIVKSVFSQEDNHPAMFLLLGMLLALKAREALAAAAAPAAEPPALATRALAAATR